MISVLDPMDPDTKSTSRGMHENCDYPRQAVSWLGRCDDQAFCKFTSRCGCVMLRQYLTFTQIRFNHLERVVRTQELGFLNSSLPPIQPGPRTAAVQPVPQVFASLGGVAPEGLREASSKCWGTQWSSAFSVLGHLTSGNDLALLC